MENLLSVLREHEQKAWVRLIVERRDAGWSLVHGQVVFGEEPADWPGESWLYEDVHFLADVLDAGDVLAVLDGSRESLDVAEHAVPIGRTATGRVRRVSSFDLHDTARLPVPSLEQLVLSVDPSDPPGVRLAQRFLVGPNSPTFTRPDVAYRAFFFGSYEDRPSGRSIPNELLVVRMPDRRAWLGPVHVRAADLTVEVGGEACGGATLEYFSPSHRHRQDVVAAGQFVVPLPDGLDSSDTWLWLTDGTEWRDYRALSGSWAAEEQLEASGVEIENSNQDPQASVEAIVYGGEGPTVEFKRQLPEKGNKTASMFKTVAAFANGSGAPSSLEWTPMRPRSSVLMAAT